MTDDAVGADTPDIEDLLMDWEDRFQRLLNDLEFEFESTIEETVEYSEENGVAAGDENGVVEDEDETEGWVQPDDENRVAEDADDEHGQYDRRITDPLEVELCDRPEPFVSVRAESYGSPLHVSFPIRPTEFVGHAGSLRTIWFCSHTWNVIARYENVVVTADAKQGASWHIERVDEHHEPNDAWQLLWDREHEQDALLDLL